MIILLGAVSAVAAIVIVIAWGAVLAIAAIALAVGVVIACRAAGNVIGRRRRHCDWCDTGIGECSCTVKCRRERCAAEDTGVGQLTAVRGDAEPPR